MHSPAKSNLSVDIVLGLLLAIAGPVSAWYLLDLGPTLHF